MTTACLLVLGGARSGKSRYAQTRAEEFEGELVYIATGQALDDEMTDRIMRHRSDRGHRWTTVEAPAELASSILENSMSGRLLLIDCLTLWTSNMILDDRDLSIATKKLVEAIANAAGPIILVTNEVGLGIVPDNVLARRFRDEAGRVNQAVAGIASEAIFVAAGLPIRLK